MFDPTAAIPRLPAWFVIAYIGVILVLWVGAAAFFGRRGAFWGTIAVLVAALIRARFVFWGPMAMMAVTAIPILLGLIAFVGWLIWLPADRLLVARRSLFAARNGQGQT